MSDENASVSEENQIPESLRASRHLGRILHRNAIEVSEIATVSNHAAVVQNLLEKIHILSRQCDLNRQLYLDAVDQSTQISNKFDHLKRMYDDGMRESDHQVNVLAQWEGQIERQTSKITDLRNTVAYLQESWNKVYRKHQLREWRVLELSRQLQQFIPEFVAPSLLDDERDGPTICDVYSHLSDNESMDPYQNARTPSTPRSDNSTDYIPPRKIFKEEDA